MRKFYFFSTCSTGNRRTRELFSKIKEINRRIERKNRRNSGNRRPTVIPAISNKHKIKSSIFLLKLRIKKLPYPEKTFVELKKLFLNQRIKERFV